MNITVRRILVGSLFVLSMGTRATAKHQESYDLTYTGALSGLTTKLRQIDPHMKMTIPGPAQDIPMSLRLATASKIEIRRAVGELSGDKAD
jgi:hypothetical protein